MIIKVTESRLFTIDPAYRFSHVYDVGPELFDEIWRRYNELHYSITDLCDFFKIKTGRSMNRRRMTDWIFRAKVYEKILPMMKRGVEAVNSSFFGELEDRLMIELLRNLKSSSTTDPKILA